MAMAYFERRFMRQRVDAKKRNILFKLSFEEWYDLWVKSGHLHERGRCKGQYVMSRYGDKGIYEIGNVFIQTCEQNHIDAAASMRGIRKTEEHKRHLSEAKKGKKLGHGAKIAATQRGVPKGPMREETKQKLRLIAIGRKPYPISADGRARISAAKREYWIRRRTQNGQPVFTKEQVINIRSLYVSKKIPIRKLAKELGCTYTTLKNMLRRRSYAWVP